VRYDDDYLARKRLMNSYLSIRLLQRINADMELWSGYGTIKSFFLQSEVMSEISQCSLELDRHIKYFEVRFLRKSY
jgi:hypothetical protein